MSDSTVKVYETGGGFPPRYTVKFENMGAGEVQAIQTALARFAKEERSLFKNGGTSAQGECAEGLENKYWEARNV